MPFLVEDGSGLENSNSYASVEEIRDFFTLRGIDLSTVSDANLQVALVNATDYIDKRFGNRFVGVPSKTGQALKWPRYVGTHTLEPKEFFQPRYINGIFIDEDSIPNQLKNGTYEYARVYLDLGDLLPLPASPFSRIDRTTGEVSGGISGRVLSSVNKVGPIEESVTYEGTRAFTGTSLKSGLVQDNSIPEYPPADLWIEPLLRSSMTGITLRRS